MFGINYSQDFFSTPYGSTKNSWCFRTPCQCSTHELTPPRQMLGMRLWTDYVGQMLLRKEVIQPHLPVRLPCYDFVPITSPTFDSSFPCGLGHWLRVLPTFVT